MSVFGKNQGAQRPTAFGTLLSAATYGQTIPKIYGMTQSPWLPIWAANLRMGAGPGQKKFKNFKKGIQNYIENIDGIIGHNPIRSVNQVFVNGTPFPMQFARILFPGGAYFYDFQNVGSPPTYPISSILVPHFWSILAGSVEMSYSYTFDDYGGQGPVTVSGNWEIPMWNEMEQGPDPTNNSGYRNFPYCYRWNQDYAAYAFSDYAGVHDSGWENVYFYVALCLPATSEQPPITKLNLVLENELGNGPEYSDAPSPYNDQQIIYPQYAGLGSSDIDLGASASLPQILPEVLGKWSIYGSGDCDFVDIIEDTIKSGLAQAALGSTTGFTQQETGLSSYDLPGLVQMKINTDVELSNYRAPIFNLPNTAGNYLICIVTGDTSNPASDFSISSTNGETWIPVLSTTVGVQIWYAKAIGGPINTVAPSDPGYDWTSCIMEVAGIDSFSAVEFNATSTTASVTVATASPTQPAYLLALPLWVQGADQAPQNPIVRLWNLLTPLNQYGFWPSYFNLFSRTVYAPGTYSFTTPVVSSIPTITVLFAFTCENPAPYPQPLGNFMDLPSLDLTRKQCRANGLWGSLSMNTQASGTDWLKTLYQAADAAPVYLGSKLYTLPYSEVSVAANGAAYFAPTSTGPIANLSDLNGDFVDKANPEMTTVDRINNPNVVQLQIISREANYNQIVIAQPESASMALYAVRKADPVVNNAIQDAAVGRMILGIMIRKNQYGGDVYAFTLTPRWSLLSPMDLITITDSLSQGAIVNVPVRLTSVKELSNGSLDCEAEPFIYGMYAPTPFTTTSPTQNLPATDTSAGDVNPPVIFEPVPGLYPGTTADQLWIVVSSSSPDYGGCIVNLSTDGGSSYFVASPEPLVGSAITGYTTADWPAAADPDTTNNLLLNLSESNGILNSYSTADENLFTYPCYVQGGNISLEVNAIPVATGTPLPLEVNGTEVATVEQLNVNGTEVASLATAAFGYELMTYGVATLTGANQYTLMATGSGHFLRRAVFDAPDSGTGVDHPTGSRFAFLSPAGTGILKLTMPPSYIGTTIYVKIQSFNTFANALQDISDVAVYSYTPTGIPGSV